MVSRISRPCSEWQACPLELVAHACALSVKAHMHIWLVIVSLQLSPAHDVQQVTNGLLATGKANFSKCVLRYTAGGLRWNSRQRSCIWQKRNTAFNPWWTHGHTPLHLATQRWTVRERLTLLVPPHTHAAQQQGHDGLFAKQLGNERRRQGTLQLPELNEAKGREDAHVSVLSDFKNWLSPPCSCDLKTLLACGTCVAP
jgi:hypothetical protein